ncbi:hypothetical protein BgiMline_021232 [Biomphalaria glabrata]
MSKARPLAEKFGLEMALPKISSKEHSKKTPHAWVLRANAENISCLELKREEFISLLAVRNAQYCMSPQYRYLICPHSTGIVSVPTVPVSYLSPQYRYCICPHSIGIISVPTVPVLYLSPQYRYRICPHSSGIVSVPTVPVSFLSPQYRYRVCHHSTGIVFVPTVPISYLSPQYRYRKCNHSTGIDNFECETMNWFNYWYSQA